jgi:hypothetical protein
LKIIKVVLSEPNRTSGTSRGKLEVYRSSGGASWLILNEKDLELPTCVKKVGE